MSTKRRTRGVNAAGWFYGQSFHSHACTADPNPRPTAFERYWAEREEDEPEEKTVSCSNCEGACFEASGDGNGNAFCCLCVNAGGYVPFTPCVACADRRRRLQ